jgi:hypothetical protein
VELTRQWITDIWADLLAEAELADAATVLFVVTGEHDLESVEAAYLSPNGYALGYAVLRAVGEQRLHEATGLHRLALFQTVADGALGGFAAMLRHELCHGEQFGEFGPGLFELNGHLRAALGVGTDVAGREDYEAIPLEYDANRAAAAYVHPRPAGEVAQLVGDERFVAYTRYYEQSEDDVLERTFAAVNERCDLDSQWNGQPLRVDIAAQCEHARQWAARDRVFDAYNPTRDGDGIVFV